VWLSHGTCENKSQRMCAWRMCHGKWITTTHNLNTAMRNVHGFKSRHMCKQVIPHIRMSHGTRAWIEPRRHVRRALIWVMAHVRMTHGTKLQHICAHVCKRRIVCTGVHAQMTPLCVVVKIIRLSWRIFFACTPVQKMRRLHMCVANGPFKEK